MTERPAFATLDPFDGMNRADPGAVANLAGGRWFAPPRLRDDIPDPLSGGAFLAVPDTEDFAPFLAGLRSCPGYGLHNPQHRPDRYVMLGRVCARAAAALAQPDTEAFFTRLIQRVMPKSWAQCRGEVTITRTFLENFAGDGVRFLARGFSNPGDRPGQESRGYRWPWGPVAVIAPFNFPLEIPALQVLGALFMGNRPLVKVDSKVSVVFEQFLRLLLHCGLPAEDVDLVHCRGERLGAFIDEAGDVLRMVQFTGSSAVAGRIAAAMNGRVRLEDSGFDWKVVGPDFDPDWLDYVAWQSDEDAYNASGQKCSAQSLAFVHRNWWDAVLPRLRDLAARRRLDPLTIGPVLTWDDARIAEHVAAVRAVPGAELCFGGEPIERGAIPREYGAWAPTAVSVPLEAFGGEHFERLTTELFGPFQVLVPYGDDDVGAMLEVLERIPNHLTAAVVSADLPFQQRVLGATVNGTTYCGMRARTTAAPQNHWFGPCGDPRAAGIGTPEAIIATWSGHREIIHDHGALAPGWEVPESA